MGNLISTIDLQIHFPFGPNGVMTGEGGEVA